MLRKITLWSILIITSYGLYGQKVKFGKISEEELLEKSYEKDSSASAAVLYRNIRVSYKYVPNEGFMITTRVHERVKIYNKDGFYYATIAERLYKDGAGDKEKVNGLRGYTYNLENGKIAKYKLKGSETFSTSLSKYRNEEKFTMPNIKEGSVIEYEYKISSPFSYNIDEVVLQYDIPIKQQHISVSTPEYYNFKPVMKGYLGVTPKYTKESGKINFQTKNRQTDNNVTTTNYSSNTVDYIINTASLDMQDVPALKKEPYVNNMNNYRSTIKYELQYVKFPDSPLKAYSTNWEKVVKTIYERPSFGQQLKQTKYFKDDLTAILGNVTTETEKIGAIFSFVQQRMNWNGFHGYNTYEGVKDAYKEKKGNVADINLILVAMLKKAGLKANPVLISTRNNGVPLFPTREGFNYVVASVELGGNTVFLDACNKFTKPNLLPTKTLNWFGRSINEDGSSQEVSVLPKKLSKEVSMMNVELKPNGDLEGKLRKNYTDYDAYVFRNKYNGVSEEDYLEKLENKNNGMEISNYKTVNKKNVSKPITESFDFYLENQADIIGDKIYFSPLLFNTLSENPFKLDQRNYPIDFAYPSQERYIANITVPSGYELTSKPEDVSLAMENNMGSFVYKIIDQGNNKLQVMADLKINLPVIPAQQYEGIKQLFKKMVEKETEKVVLSKI
ncbi:MAG: DUF3857 domain-containing protein [Cyanobacteria bacterium P01_A01_bin.84]